jgi:Protein of unknown function (DUF2934)
MSKTRGTTSPEVKKPKKVKTQPPTQEEIALRAYHIYLERHGAPGNPLEDWVRAERELAGAPKKTTRKSKVVSIAA